MIPSTAMKSFESENKTVSMNNRQSQKLNYQHEVVSMMSRFWRSEGRTPKLNCFSLDLKTKYQH